MPFVQFDPNTFRATHITSDAELDSLSQIEITQNHAILAGTIADYICIDSAVALYLPFVKQRIILKMALETGVYVESRYPRDTQITLLGLLLEAHILNLANRRAYLLSALSWVKEVIQHFHLSKGLILQMQSANEVDSYIFELSSFNSSDPLVSIETALTIAD